MEITALIFAVIIGVGLYLILKPKKQIVTLMLTFSGAYLLSITVLKLLPEIYSKGGAHIGLYVIVGLVLQLILDFFSKGAEHGHLHAIDMHRFPWALFVSLMLHAFMEGLPLSDHHHHELLWAIVIHKVPIAMVLSSFLMFYTENKLKAFVFLFVFAMMTPLGSLSGDIFSFFIRYSNEINAIVAGVFMHIATIILFESSQEHRFNLKKFTALLFGVFLALMV